MISLQQEPLFSIIMPNYNNGIYIKEAIESVLAQTYGNWELVIYDDASTDNSLDVIKPFLDNARIKLITNETNKGVAHAAKQAVEKSSGQLIGTLDADDVLDKDALLIMVNEYRAYPECGLIYSNYYKCDNNLNILGKIDLLDPLPDDMSFQEILLGRKYDTATISWHFRTFRRSAYDKTEGYDPTLLCYEDRDIYYKLEKVTKVKCINKCLLYYRDTTEQGAYRRNPKRQYFWFICEYRETGRRLGVKLPFADNKNISPFLSNVMYMHLIRHSKSIREKFRLQLQSFLFETGYNYLGSNKLLAFLYIMNSYIYGYTPITFARMKKFVDPTLSHK